MLPCCASKKKLERGKKKEMLALNTWIAIVTSNTRGSVHVSAYVRSRLDKPDKEDAWFEDSFVLRVHPGMDAALRRAICTLLWITDFKWVSVDREEDGGDGGVSTQAHYRYLRQEGTAGDIMLYKRDVADIVKIDADGRFVWNVGDKIMKRRVKYIEISYNPEMFVGVH